MPHQSKPQMDEIRRQKSKGLSAEQKARLNSGLRLLESTADPVGGKKEDAGYRLPRPLRVGDAVLIFDIDKKATVLRPAEGDPPEVLVQAGILQTRVPVSNLRLIKEEPQKKLFRTVTRSVSRAQAPASTEVNVRGLTAEEGRLDVLYRELVADDDAVQR